MPLFFMSSASLWCAACVLMRVLYVILRGKSLIVFPVRFVPTVVPLVRILALVAASKFW